MRRDGNGFSGRSSRIRCTTVVNPAAPAHRWSTFESNLTDYDTEYLIVAHEWRQLEADLVPEYSRYFLGSLRGGPLLRRKANRRHEPDDIRRKRSGAPAFWIAARVAP
jgi:hypothetical protein